MYICNFARELFIITILLVIETVLSLNAPAQISNYLAKTICKQMKSYDQFGTIQAPVKKRPRLSSDKNCGWHVFDNCDGARSCSYKRFVKCKVNAGGEEANLRIVGGEEAPRNSYPSMLTLKKNGRYICGAVILNENWALTAAHCTKDTNPDQIIFVAGNHEIYNINLAIAQFVKATKIIQHAEFSMENRQIVNDISVCKFEPPLQFNKYVQPVQLPPIGYKPEGKFSAVGWGRLTETGSLSNQLQHVRLPVISDEKCQQLYRDFKMTEKELCTLETGKDGCRGDSGGPLYKVDGDQQIVIGITSWGNGCGRENRPGVWTEVAHFISWIQNNIKSESRPQNKTTRIVRGVEDAPLHGYPSMLTLNINEKYTCGATIINKNWIVTAAHCAMVAGGNVTIISITAGDHELNKMNLKAEQKSRCEKLIIHPDFVATQVKLVNDIALCKLETPLTFNEFVQPVQLPDPTYRETGNVMAVGWGSTREGGSPSNILLQVELPTTTDKLCQKQYKVQMTEKEICTLQPDKDGCQGDSGGPLFKIHGNVHILIGISTSGRGCAKSKSPGVWTEVAYFVPWIKDTMSKH